MASRNARNQRPPALRHAFVDRGFEGEAFCRRFLESTEFPAHILKRRVKRGMKSQPKADQAADLAEQITGQGELSDDLALEYCKEPRSWLAVRFGKPRALPAQLNSYQFLFESGPVDAFYGPWVDGETRWYIYTEKVNNWVEDAQERVVKAEVIRWSVIVEVTSEFTALHWHGFGASEDRDHPVRSGTGPQFAYWSRVPNIFRKCEEMFETDLSPRLLHRLVFETLWDQYFEKPGYRWTDRRIRAEKMGVAMHAHSAATVDASGLRALTDALGDAACRVLGVSDASKKKEVRGEMLHLVLKDWGPKSYEFTLDDGSDIGVKHFRAHCYFGLKPPDAGPDGLQHLSCFKEFGGSRGALKFLLPHWKS